MELSIYQSIKLQILDLLALSKDAVHIHIGIGVFLVAVMIWKKGRIEGVCLFPVFGVAILMEILDLRDDLNSLGYLRWSASGHDIINTTFWPIILVFMVWIKKLYRKIRK